MKHVLTALIILITIACALLAIGCEKVLPCVTGWGSAGFKVVDGDRGRDKTHCIPCRDVKTDEERAVCRGYRTEKPLDDEPARPKDKHQTLEINNKEW